RGGTARLSRRPHAQEALRRSIVAAGRPDLIRRRPLPPVVSAGRDSGAAIQPCRQTTACAGMTRMSEDGEFLHKLAGGLTGFAASLSPRAKTTEGRAVATSG